MSESWLDVHTQRIQWPHHVVQLASVGKCCLAEFRGYPKWRFQELLRNALFDARSRRGFVLEGGAGEDFASKVFDLVARLVGFKTWTLAKEALLPPFSFAGLLAAGRDGEERSAEDCSQSLARCHTRSAGGWRVANLTSAPRGFELDVRRTLHTGPRSQRQDQV